MHNLVAQEFDNNTYSNKVQVSGYKSEAKIRYIMLYGASKYKEATIIKNLIPITVPIEANMVDLKDLNVPLVSDFSIQFT